MTPKLATIVVESRLLVREALKSLMAEHSYRVVCDVGSTAGIGTATVCAEPKLIILGGHSADEAVAEASAIRAQWLDSKIILLYEYASPADFEKLFASEIDGCVPLFASPDTLFGTLDIIVIGDVRIIVLTDARSAVIQPAQPKETHQSETRLESNGTEHKDVSVSIGATQHTQPSVTLQDHPKLSEREIQILNSLVKGHATKVIARTCDVSEATVKVDMKSIMRKIRLGNRSQAAVWAIQNGYAANGFNRRLLCPDSATIAASITEAAIKSVATIVDRFRNAEAELPALAHADSVGDKARPGSDTWPLLIDEVRKTDIGAAKRRGE